MQLQSTLFQLMSEIRERNKAEEPKPELERDEEKDTAMPPVYSKIPSPPDKGSFALGGRDLHPDDLAQPNDSAGDSTPAAMSSVALPIGAMGVHSVFAFQLPTGSPTVYDNSRPSTDSVNLPTFFGDNDPPLPDFTATGDRGGNLANNGPDASYGTSRHSHNNNEAESIEDAPYTGTRDPDSSSTVSRATADPKPLTMKAWTTIAVPMAPAPFMDLAHPIPFLGCRITPLRLPQAEISKLLEEHQSKYGNRSGFEALRSISPEQRDWINLHIKAEDSELLSIAEWDSTVQSTILGKLAVTSLIWITQTAEPRKRAPRNFYANGEYLPVSRYSPRSRSGAPEAKPRIFAGGSGEPASPSYEPTQSARQDSVRSDGHGGYVDLSSIGGGFDARMSYGGDVPATGSVPLGHGPRFVPRGGSLHAGRAPDPKTDLIEFAPVAPLPLLPLESDPPARYRVRRLAVEEETLREFKVVWRPDRIDPDYLFILQELSPALKRDISGHTRELRHRRLAETRERLARDENERARRYNEEREERLTGVSARSRRRDRLTISKDEAEASETARRIEDLERAKRELYEAARMKGDEPAALAEARAKAQAEALLAKLSAQRIPTIEYQIETANFQKTAQPLSVDVSYLPSLPPSRPASPPLATSAAEAPAAIEEIEPGKAEVEEDIGAPSKKKHGTKKGKEGKGNRQFLDTEVVMEMSPEARYDPEEMITPIQWPAEPGKIYAKLSDLKDVGCRLDMSAQLPPTFRFPPATLPSEATKAEETEAVAGETGNQTAIPFRYRKTRPGRRSMTPSLEYTSSTQEFRPLYLLERDRRSSEIDPILPELPALPGSSEEAYVSGHPEPLENQEAMLEELLAQWVEVSEGPDQQLPPDSL
ncbi:hypothetical protein EJ06DRAFT_164671 [Trichodelitschia bisporula]|uniref:Uncharacterized protein n=1 Tax=Trichodelitschia bisporula TaxID=703511 RepID=A0A6G1HMW5_9PEZI|nr:hypothetical protein EJ06DRAFT_164671 [Trichodelitschia bisporula]